MNRDLIKNALLSSINLLTNELEFIDDDGLRNVFELTLAQLALALREIEKESCTEQRLHPG